MTWWVWRWRASPRWWRPSALPSGPNGYCLRQPQRA
jgi:hypothetical protein